MNKISFFRFTALLIVFLQLTACLAKQSNPRSTVVYESKSNSSYIIEPSLMAAESTDKIAYLTFDDGPSANTESILNILRRYGIHATFFVVGKGSLEGQRLYRLIVKEGHLLGNHTYSHNYASLYSSVHAFAQDTQRLSKLLERITGVKPTLLRYPGGSNNQICRHYGGAGIMTPIINEMKREGYVYTDWNVSSTDAASAVQPKNEIIDAVLNGSKNKSKAIILMHDVTAKITTIEALPEVIEGLIKQGFHFDVLGPDKFLFQFHQNGG
jgi:peptidoglycan/xylan/chitin deacetylase (PgdA/CDA1 family)